MQLENDKTPRIWPEVGICGASYRIMFPLAALWAMAAVALWQWGDSVLQAVAVLYLWHLHEMTFGLGGAALIGYLLSACSSWTGRAPVSGWPVLALAMLWGVARLVTLGGAMVPIGVLAGVNAMVFWGLAGLLMREAWRGSKVKIWGHIGFVTMAGAVSGLVLLGHGPGPLLAPAVFMALLIVVGGRMAFGFLLSDGQRRGLTLGHDRPLFGLLGALAVLLSVLLLTFDLELAAGQLLATSAVLQLVRLRQWPLSRVKGNSLLAMLVIGFAWLPVGLFLWSAVLWQFAIVPQASALHAAVMGPLASLMMAVMARPVARRGELGLKAAPGTWPAFLLLQLAIILRMFDWQMISAVLWCLAWALFFGVLILASKHPIPRPIFSGSRQASKH